MRTLFIVALAALLGCAGGCLKPSFPPLHPVHGSIVYDGKPAKGGIVQFKPVGGDSRFVVSGLVMMDGKYTLNTSIAGGSERDLRPGAPAGDYTAWYGPLGDGGKPGEPTRAMTVVTVKEGDNEFRLLVPKQ